MIYDVLKFFSERILSDKSSVAGGYIPVIADMALGNTVAGTMAKLIGSVLSENGIVYFIDKPDTLLFIVYFIYGALVIFIPDETLKKLSNKLRGISEKKIENNI